ncbi:malto-oligosyltrehalose trehalohydrolase [Caenimonas sedimenti]|uniref:Malto-oligosyltrehalose trehalohydrolase n=1 Tax=Caenimonas sedimenti TaxID=2596921 RepID=A0A562ZXM4_9BURK|nr:malto-oligosyltrehalose trehalohydrolase [Caenimonas sedimenti]TWO72894.1 malto-oligosyltrehalose trehalohydrolase [Caenimonas sedimenti]
MLHAHDMPFGARLLPGGGARCRLWAPAAKSAEVAWGRAAGAVTELVPAQPAGGGWWECDLPLANAGELYQWRIDGELAVPDPASRANPQGPHAPSQLVDPLDFPWDEDWAGRPWHETVLYELHLGTFTPEGTFLAAAGRLQELADLGVTAIELMPVSAFPGRFGWGYDGVLPFAPHPAYGTPAELKYLVQAAHRLGLMVFMDVVYNHFGPDGNYLHAYAPAFFSKTASSPWGAAINFDGPDSQRVREFFIHNALYWVEEFRIDGLRLDAVHAIIDTSRPDVLEQLSAAVRGATAGRHVHLVLENENNHYHRLAPEPMAERYDGQWNDDFHHALHVALTGETHGYYHDYGSGVEPLELLGRSLSHGMVFEDSRRKPGGARETVAHTPPQPLTALVNFAHNHDQVGNRARGERLSQLVPPAAALLPTLLALLTPAIPMLFQGEECGAEQPFLYFADWDGELRDAVRAGRKREFAHAGDDLPDPCSAATFEASRPDCASATGSRGRAWQELVHSALAARARWITPRQALLDHGKHTHQRVGATGLAVQWRYTDGQMLALELNLGPEPLAVPAQHLGPVEAETVFSYRRPAEVEAGVWPAWSVRWTLGTEITL